MYRSIFHCRSTSSWALLLQTVFVSVVTGVTQAYSQAPMTALGSTIDLKFEELRTATKIVLLIVPFPTAFRSHVNKDRLTKVACVFEVHSGQGSTFEEITEITSRSVRPDEGPLRYPDMRVGVVFKNGADLIRGFYFEDRGAAREVAGMSGDVPVVASAEFPSRVRMLLARPEVKSVNPQSSACHHL
ncbi:hypothetical protein [Bradyrhizobium sp. 1]|uniref:hypothetical protein n=1 Tax=Bradyrhizobium sp. 1 TaxID=241591 RepID=UPI001FF993A9|nr:hypothetical protein [Bradyrhizobium sp. 1]MCK1392285.1 hypothetical protein [Bradyrhizobium sp. 1]